MGDIATCCMVKMPILAFSRRGEGCYLVYGMVLMPIMPSSRNERYCYLVYGGYVYRFFF
jgi:hypothetical protein